MKHPLDKLFRGRRPIQEAANNAGFPPDHLATLAESNFILSQLRPVLGASREVYIKWRHSGAFNGGCFVRSDGSPAFSAYFYESGDGPRDTSSLLHFDLGGTSLYIGSLPKHCLDLDSTVANACAAFGRGSDEHSDTVLAQVTRLTIWAYVPASSELTATSVADATHRLGRVLGGSALLPIRGGPMATSQLLELDAEFNFSEPLPEASVIERLEAVFGPLDRTAHRSFRDSGSLFGLGYTGSGVLHVYGRQF